MEAYKITGFNGAAGESGMSIEIKLKDVSHWFYFTTENFKPYCFGAKDLLRVLLAFLIYNFFLLFPVETLSVQYAFGFFSFLFSMINGGWAIFVLLFNRDFREWHGAEHKLVALLRNCKNISASDFKNSSRVSASCGSHDALWTRTLFVYCFAIIWLDKVIQYFTGDAYSWIIFIVLFFALLNQYKKLCDNWLWRSTQKYLSTAEPCREKMEETLGLGWRIKRFTEGDDFE